MTKTEAILKGIDLLERDKLKRFKNISGENKKNTNGVIEEGEIILLNKK